MTLMKNFALFIHLYGSYWRIERAYKLSQMKYFNSNNEIKTNIKTAREQIDGRESAR